MRELRTAVMIRVEASWNDAAGARHTVFARMEDKSLNGACIRVKSPISLGVRIQVRWRFEQFSGISKYCREEGSEYVVGILREKIEIPLPDPAQVDDTPTSAARSAKIFVPADRLQAPTQATPPAENKLGQFQTMQLAVKRDQSDRNTNPTVNGILERQGREINHEVYVLDRPLPVAPTETAKQLEIAQGSTQPEKQRVVRKEKKTMTRKWQELSPWHNKQEEQDVAAKPPSEATPAAANLVAVPPRNAAAGRAREPLVDFQAELLPVEDIYRMAGIMNPRRGYSVRKVVEMLQSKHLLGVSIEMKRAAILMALDAAEVSIGQVQQDAKARQEALDSYEVQQKKQVEAEWVRKAEENVQIEEDLVRVKAHYMARISRNLEGIALEKSTFDSWMARKKQESDAMAEKTVNLCLKQATTEPAAAPLASAAAAGVCPSTME